MPAPDKSAPPLAPPRLPMALLRALLPPAERAEVLADVAAEHAEHAARRGPRAAHGWLWRQALTSAPALVGWSWWRGWTGFEPQANAYHPGGLMLNSWIADARYAVRRLRAHVGYTLLAVLTLALGVGGTAAVFGIARPLLFQALPYAHAGEVGMFWMPGWWYEAEFSFLRGRFPGFREVAAYRPADVTLRQGEAPARLVPGIATSAELFGVLGARPFLGRGFRPGEDVPGAEPVAVVSYGLWRELGGTPAVLGRRLTLDGTPTTVVGVMPRGFWFPDPGIRIWRPQPIEPERQNGSFALVGRVAPGRDVHRMAPQMRQLAATLADRFRDVYVGDGDKTAAPALTPLRDALVGSTRPALVAMLAAMALILLIACANVAALMLGQVEGRSSELAVRSALGANRRRLTQQVVLEALLVGLAAGAVGGGLAAAAFGALARALPIGAWAEHAVFGWTTFAAALAVAVGAVLLVVLAPSLALWRGDLRGALNRARTGGVQGRGGRLERGLVVVEVALAMLIASGATLLVRSVANLYAVDPGVRTRDVAVVDVLSRREMRGRERGPVVERLLAELATLPGVQAAATTKLPLRGAGDSFLMAGGGQPAGSEAITYFRIVSPGYFETMGIKVREGRTFTAADRSPARDTAPAQDSTREVSVVVNEALARKFFPGENPVGRHLRGGFSVRQRVVGVVANVAEASLTDAPAPTAYYVGGQIAWIATAQTFVLRAERPGGAAALLEAARRTVERVAPDFAVQEVTTMARVMDRAVGPARQVMTLLSLLSALALGLGAVGIYGVISHFATRRKRDWAIRVALGLPGARVVRHIVGQGAALVGAGIALGAVGTAATARLLASFLFGVGAVDAVAFAAASATLLAVGLAAAFVPARRAGTVNPAVVLREQ